MKILEFWACAIAKNILIVYFFNRNSTVQVYIFIENDLLGSQKLHKAFNTLQLYVITIMFL